MLITHKEYLTKVNPVTSYILTHYVESCNDSDGCSPSGWLMQSKCSDIVIKMENITQRYDVITSHTTSSIPLQSNATAGFCNDNLVFSNDTGMRVWLRRGTADSHSLFFSSLYPVLCFSSLQSPISHMMPSA